MQGILFVLDEFFHQLRGGCVVDLAVPADVGTLAALAHALAKAEGKTLGIFAVGLFHKIRYFCALTAVGTGAHLQKVAVGKPQAGDPSHQRQKEALPGAQDLCRPGDHPHGDATFFLLDLLEEIHAGILIARRPLALIIFQRFLQIPIHTFRLLFIIIPPQQKNTSGNFTKT